MPAPVESTPPPHPRPARRRLIAVVSAAAVAAVAVTVAAVVITTVRPPAPAADVRPGNRTPSGAELSTLPAPADLVLGDVWVDDALVDPDSGPIVIDDSWVLTAPDTPTAPEFAAVDLVTGERVWTVTDADVFGADTPHPGLRAFVRFWLLDAPTPIIAARSDSIEGGDRVITIDGRTGKPLWVSAPGTEYVGALDDGSGDLLVRTGDERASGGELQRISPTGPAEVRWAIPAAGDVAVRGGRVFVVAGRTTVHDAADGAPLASWSEDCVGDGRTAPALVGARLVSDRGDGRIHVCDLDGREVWSTQAERWMSIADDWGSDAQHPAATSQLLVATGRTDGPAVVVMDTADGHETAIPDAALTPDSTTRAYRVGDRLIVAATRWREGTTLEVFDALSGGRLWSAQNAFLHTLSTHALTAGGWTRPASDGGEYLVTGLALDDGAELWRTSWDGQVPYFLGTHPYLWGEHGTMTALTRAG